MRSETLTPLLDSIHSEVKVEIYARWRISDIVAGASDVAVLDVAKQKGADFRVHDALHAKIYIADESALVGSANVTEAGLGRLGGNHSNLEILLRCPTNCSEVQSVINDLRAKSLPPCRFDDELIRRMQHIASPMLNNMDNWIPASSPKDVLGISQKGDMANDDIISDCYALGIGAGTSEKRLREIVKMRRIFAVLHDTLNQGYYDSLSDDKGCDILIDSFYVKHGDAMKKWGILKEWIETLSEDMYIASTRDGSQEVRKGRRLLSDIL